MKSFWTRSALAATALMCVGAANAYVIDFENLGDQSALAPSLPFIFDNEYMVQGNYFIQGQDLNNPTRAPNSAYVPDGAAFVGGLVTGNDPASSCPSICPSGNSSTFLAMVNDGVVHLGARDGAASTISSFTAAFLRADGVAVGSTAGYLAVEGDRRDGSYALGFFPLAGANAFANFNVSSAAYLFNDGQDGSPTGSLTSGNITDYFLFAYSCSASTGSCSALNTDKGQFALDNVNITAAVPEPSQWLLMLAGLGAVGAIARRRRSI